LAGLNAPPYVSKIIVPIGAGIYAKHSYESRPVVARFVELKPPHKWGNYRDYGRTELAGLNALQGESLRDEPCPMSKKALFPIGAGIYAKHSYESRPVVARFIELKPPHKWGNYGFVIRYGIGNYSHGLKLILRSISIGQFRISHNKEG